MTKQLTYKKRLEIVNLFLFKISYYNKWNYIKNIPFVLRLIFYTPNMLKNYGNKLKPK